jgi:flagellar protein FlgJ
MAAGVQLNALDPRSLADLRRQARAQGDSDEALRGAAKQFEALFLQMMLKSMRQANPNNGPMDNDQTRLYQELYDQQLASNIAQGRGAGLADALFRQLGGGKGKAATDMATAAATATTTTTMTDRFFPLNQPPRRAALARAQNTGAAANGALTPEQAAALLGRTVEGEERVRGQQRPAVASLLGRMVEGAEREKSGEVKVAGASALSAKLAAAIDTARDAGGEAARRARAFVAEIWPHALEAAKATGIPARFMVAQAALETGWGAKQQKNADGSPSHNLFNIKAGAGWTGDTAARTTVDEYDAASGQWTREDARFRSYPSYREAFADYARLMTANPRYAAIPGTRDAASFAQKLQNAGYATDPAYAQKLTRVIGGDTLRHALAVKRG